MGRRRTALEKASGAVMKAVAGLPPDGAALRLAVLAAAEPPGLRRRVLLSARIAMMRKALEAPEPETEVVVAPPPPEPEPEPVVEPPPVVKAPKPLSKGVMTSINLDDVARMLSASVEEAPAQVAEPEPEPEVEAEADAKSPVPDPSAMFAALDWEGSAARLDPGEVPGMAAGETAAGWDQWPTEAGPAMAEASPTEGAAEEPAGPARKAGKRGKAGVAVPDASAALAALVAAEPAAPPGKPKALAIDLSAQFAAMDDPGDGA